MPKTPARHAHDTRRDSTASDNGQEAVESRATSRDTYPRLGQDARYLPISDEEVVRRVRGGETALFEVIMRRYNQRLYRMARTILRDDGEAEDVTQQAYVNAYRHLEQFNGRALFATWLTRIAVNEAITRARARSRLDASDTMDERSDNERIGTLRSPDPERQALTNELRTLLESAIDALPDGYRLVFVMRDVEGMSTAESAAYLDISEDTAKQRLHRARRMLREALYQRTGAVSAGAFAFEAPRCDRLVAATLGEIQRTSCHLS